MPIQPIAGCADAFGMFARPEPDDRLNLTIL